MGFARDVLPWLIVLGPLTDLVRIAIRRGRAPVAGSVAAVVAAGAGLLLVDADPDPAGALAWDRLGGLVAAFVVGVTLMVRANATRSLALDATSPRFAMGAAAVASLGALTSMSAHPVVLLLGWVATTPVVVLLVRHDGRPEARAAARQTARSLGTGDVALVAAVAVAVAALDVDVLRPGGDAADGTGATVVALAVLVAAMARGALLPFHRWLAGSVAAPTPLSALLHAGVVNAGGLLLVRWSGVLAEATVAVVAGTGVAVTTIVVAGAVARTRPDVKGALVWSTIGQMGFMTLQAVLGLAGPAIAHLLGHGMYKAHLFLASGGVLDRRRGDAVPARAVPLPVAAVAGAGLVAVGALVVRPHFLDTGWVAIVPLAFLAATVTAGLRPWLGAGRPTALATAVAGAGTLGVLWVTEAVDRIVAASLPTEVPATAPALAVVAVVVVAAGAALTHRLSTGHSPRSDRAWARAHSLGAPAPVPVR